MLKLIPILLLGVLAICPAYSQSIAMEFIGSSGEFELTSFGSASWSVGEASVESETAPGGILTQGFQQSFETIIVHGTLPVASPLGVFPNPTSGLLWVEGTESGWLELWDLSGKIVLQTPVSGYRTSLDLGKLPAGMYLLRVKEASTSKEDLFKILKN